MEMREIAVVGSVRGEIVGDGEHGAGTGLVSAVSWGLISPEGPTDLLVFDEAFHLLASLGCILNATSKKYISLE